MCGSLDSRGNAFRNTCTQRVDRRIINCNQAHAAFHSEFDKFNHDDERITASGFGKNHKEELAADGTDEADALSHRRHPCYPRLVLLL
jgi:hypothetical protein